MSDAEAMTLMQSLGPHAQPHPVGLNAVNLTAADGRKWIVLVLSTPVGRQALWLSPDDADRWAAVLTESATKGRAAATPLLTVPTIPEGLPLPGSPVTLPRMN